MSEVISNASSLPLTLLHAAIELIIIGCVTFYMNNRISNLSIKLEEQRVMLDKHSKLIEEQRNVIESQTKIIEEMRRVLMYQGQIIQSGFPKNNRKTSEYPKRKRDKSKPKKVVFESEINKINTDESGSESDLEQINTDDIDPDLEDEINELMNNGGNINSID